MTTYISTSERAAFKRCRFQWYWTYMRRVKPIETATPLRFGSLIHKALEGYYRKGLRRGPKPAGLFEQAYEAELKQQVSMGFRDEDGSWHEAGDLGVAMLEHYLARYGADDEWKVLATEQRFEAPIVSERGNQIGTYVGVLDLIMEHRPTGEIEIWDHKAVKSIDTGYLLLDDQAGGYWAYGPDALIAQKVLKPGQQPRTVNFNFLRKAKPDPRKYRLSPEGKKIYLNQDGSDSQKQPAETFVRHPTPRTENERREQRARVADELREILLVRAGKLGIYKNPGKFTCMGCSVRDICELHEAGGDYEEMAALTTVPRGEWKPLEYVAEAVAYELEH